MNASQDNDVGHGSSSAQPATISDTYNQKSCATSAPADKSSMKLSSPAFHASPDPKPQLPQLGIPTKDPRSYSTLDHRPSLASQHSDPLPLIISSSTETANLQTSSIEIPVQNHVLLPDAETAASYFPSYSASNTAVPSIAASTSSFSSGSDDEQTLETYLQNSARRSPLAAWPDSSARFTERIATNYSLPQPSHSLQYSEVDDHHQISLSKSSMAPSQAHLPHVQKHIASDPRYASYNPLPRVSDHTSYARSSDDRECGGVKHVPIPESDVDGASAQPRVCTPAYECTFFFLDCSFTTSDEAEWRLHSLSHFYGLAPPRSVACPLCDSRFNADNGYIAWEAHMSHLSVHFWIGETLAKSRPDLKLFRYLWLKRIIDDAEYNELNGRGTIFARWRPEEPSRTTEGPCFDPPRRSVPRYPRHKKPLNELRGDVLEGRLDYRRLNGIPVAAPLFETKGTAQKLHSPPLPLSTNEQAVTEETVINVAKSRRVNSFSLGTEFVDFLTQELGEAKDLLEVIVVTGTEDRAFVAPCADFAEKMWPELGRPLLLSLVPVLEPLKEFQRIHDYGSLETEKNISLGSFGRSLAVSTTFVKNPALKNQLGIAFEVQGDQEEVCRIAEIFKWLSAVCRKPIPDKLLYSHVWCKSSGPRLTSFHPMTLEQPQGTDGSSRCWHGMFKGYVLAEGFPIPERGSQRGAELPFDLMTLLGLALYPINFGQGIILKGENTALIPSVHADDENSVQWHYLEGDGVGGPLTWDCIKRYCENIYPSKDFNLLRSKRTFVGYFPSVKVHLGTRDSGFDEVDFSGAEYDDKTAFILGNELVGQVGTSVMNFFTAQVSGKLMVHQTAHQRLLGVHDNIMDKIRNSKDFPILLFDFKTKQGWLVPELSAVLHMALAWASYQHQSADVLSNMPFAEARPDGGMAAYDAILRSADSLLPEHIKVGDNNDRQISVRQALVPFFLRIGQIKDQQLQRCACGLKESKDLVGYEFKEIASFEEHLQLRRSKVDVDKSGGWLRLVSCKPEMAVILCSNLKAPIQPASTQHVCPFWQTVPTDQYYLTASVSCLRQLAKRCGGEESLRLYNDIYCTLPKKDPGPGVCGTRNWPCCNPLLELSKHPSKKVLRFENEGALIIGKAVPHTEDNSSLRALWRSLSSGKDEKSQNGNFPVLQANHQTLTGAVNPPLPQNAVSSGVP